MDYQYRQPTSGFAIASLAMGILSIATTCTGILPIPFGALGILFAILVYRKGRALHPQALAGIVTSVMGLFFGVAICIYSLTLLPTMLQSQEYRDQLNAISQQMYGMSFDDMMEQAYGVDLDELFGIE